MSSSGVLKPDIFEALIAYKQKGSGVDLTISMAFDVRQVHNNVSIIRIIPQSRCQGKKQRNKKKKSKYCECKILNKNSAEAHSSIDLLFILVLSDTACSSTCE